MATVICEPRPDGEVEVIGSGRLSPGEAALLIAEIARAAKQAHSISGQPLPAAGTQVEAAIAYAEIAWACFLGHRARTIAFSLSISGRPLLASQFPMQMREN
jgi:hypothetical protein